MCVCVCVCLCVSVCVCVCLCVCVCVVHVLQLLMHAILISANITVGVSMGNIQVGRALVYSLVIIPVISVSCTSENVFMKGSICFYITKST